MDKIRHKSKSKGRRKRPSASTKIKKQKPLKIDVSSLLNHLKLIQKSIPHLPTNLDHVQPDLQMLNFQTKATGENSNSSGDAKASASDRDKTIRRPMQDWYILVASTPYAISAQLIPIPKSKNWEIPDVVVPDFIQCTPISVWTSTPISASGSDRFDNNLGDRHRRPNEEGQSPSRILTQQNQIEILTCNPRIVTYEPPSSSSSQEYLQVAILCGLKSNRLLSVQLSIYAYVGMQGCEGRFVMTKSSAQSSSTSPSSSSPSSSSSVLEPLLVDTDEDVRRKYKYMEHQQQQQQHKYQNGQLPSGGSAPSGGRMTKSSSFERDATASMNSSHESTHMKKWEPFQPKGGVVSISPVYRYQVGDMGKEGRKRKGAVEDDASRGYFVWITYGDGTFVRMPKWAFFGVDNLDDLDHPFHHGRDFVFKGKLDFLTKRNADGKVVAESSSSQQQPFSSMMADYVVIPLPRFFPSLLSQPAEMPFSAVGLTLPDISLDDSGFHHSGIEEDESDYFDDDEDEDGDCVVRKEKADVDHHEFFEALCYKKESNLNPVADTYPTLCFYNNENQLYSDLHKSADNEDVQTSTVQTLIRGGTTIIGGTAALAKTMLGGVIGVLGRSKTTTQNDEIVNGMEIRGAGTKSPEENYDIMDDPSGRASIFPALHKKPSLLSLGSAMYDAPRRITHVSIDPKDGKLMACADNLGRVQLIDLDSKQPIRMWKGFREATCHWIQLPYIIDGEVHAVKYLAIHSRQRNVVEIFRTTYGPRVGRFDVKSDGISLVQCPVNMKGGESFERNFELRISKSSNKNSILKEVTILDNELIEASQRGTNDQDGVSGGGILSPAQQRAQEGSIQMQLLKQLLASESAVPSDLNGVYDALTQITALSDLSKALDFLALASHLQNMGVSDSSFHSEVVLHAREQLDIALSDQAVATSKNSHILELSRKIDFHTQLILAYDEVHAFESSEHKSVDKLDWDEKPEASNPWVEEAVGWIETYEAVCGYSIDSELPAQAEPQLTFAAFSKACLQGGPATTQDEKAKTVKLYLCDSTRDRKQILLHLFRPLTGDIFTLKTVHQVFEHMSIAQDFDTLLQYFGEWFMSLPKDDINLQSGGISCPAVRWLRDIVVQYLESDAYEKAKEAGNVILLHSLYDFCSDSEDLPRAFALSVVCYQAISAATSNIEDKTYGLTSLELCVQPWKDLLRKIRVCQLISFRLYGINLGALPITVSNIDAGDIFAMHQFIAHDELMLTQNSREIIELELACIASPFTFVPSHEEGDTQDHWKMLQLSCVERYNPKNLSLGDGKGPAPLLFFLQNFYDTVHLASHRALILAQKWGREPDSLHFLENALSALRSIKHVKVLSAVSQEIWNNFIRPVYRGILFGFHEAHEICEEIISPLCDDPSWFTNLNKFSTELIMLLRSTVDGLSEENEESTDDEDTEVWPPHQKDVIIENLLRRSGNLDDSSLEIHGAVVCAIQLTDSMESLTMCFPMLDILFLRESLIEHHHVNLVPTEYQNIFIANALQRKASRFEGNMAVSYADLDDIITLGRSWGRDKSQMLTEFLLVMYELGKDNMIQHLITSTRLIEVERFEEGGMLIACVRLEAALSTLKKVKQCRSILAMLDADTCEWVKEQAEISTIENSKSICTHRDDGELIPLASTQELILRVKRVSSANRIDVNALSVMCETLLQAVEVFEST